MDMFDTHGNFATFCVLTDLVVNPNKPGFKGQSVSLLTADPGLQVQIPAWAHNCHGD